MGAQFIEPRCLLTKALLACLVLEAFDDAAVVSNLMGIKPDEGAARLAIAQGLVGSIAIAQQQPRPTGLAEPMALRISGLGTAGVEAIHGDGLGREGSTE